jgi:hypothetical protein
MSYRDDVDALAARHTALEHELAAKTREVADAARLLEDARDKRRLPVLDNIRVAAPCTASWDRMLGDDRVRHCHDCNKHVFNLSGMTRDEAEALLVDKTGELCVRYYQRSDGTILTADCSVGISKRRKRRLVAAGATALLAGGGGIAARSMMHVDRVERTHRNAIMGTTVAPPPPPLHVHVAPLPPDAYPTMGTVAVPVPVMGRVQRAK